MMRTVFGALACAMALTAITPAALAQDDLEERRKAAATLADNAFDLLQQGLFAEAADLFRKADERFHSPMFVLFRADAEEKQGHLVEARALLQTILDEELAEYAPSSFHKAKEDATKRAASLDDRVPKVTITVSGATSGPWTVTLDGKELTPSDLADPVPLNPGSHQVKVNADDGRSDKRSIEVGEGDRSSVELVLVSTEPGADATDGDGGGGSTPWVWPAIAFGVGGAGLLVGMISGGVFLGAQSDLKDACENDGDSDPNTCPPDKQADGDEVLMLGNVSTVGFVIAGVGAIVGTVLLVVPLGDEDDSGGAQTSLRPSLQLGAGSAALVGRF